MSENAGTECKTVLRFALAITAIVISSVPDSWHFGTAPDPHSRILQEPLTYGSGSCSLNQYPGTGNPQDENKKLFFSKYFAYYQTFWRYIYIIFSQIKFHKMSQNNRNQGFSHYFWRFSALFFSFENFVVNVLPMSVYDKRQQKQNNSS